MPAAGTVLVRNRAAAVNFIDTLIRRGEMPPGMAPRLPHTPGVEGAGVVESVGTGVTRVAVGDQVAWIGPVGAGGYGTHSLIAEPFLVKLKDEIGFTEAAAIPVNAMTAWHMLMNLGRAEAGTTVLVHAAAGGVGTMILQIAKHIGAKTIASVSSNKIAHALKQGADHAIDYQSEDVVAKVKEITSDQGVDLSLNPISGETLKSDMESLAPFGTAVLFGFLAGPPTGTFAEDLVKHFRKSIAVRVSDIYTYYGNRPDGFSKDLGHVFGLLHQGILKPRIFAEMPVQKAGDAHRMLESGEVIGKLVLTVAD
jgi:NADPH2:quinone reductase